ncbi:hypothetical protein H310_05721 [Aphanomyces invadans]|uniref:Uncharacterized protein n=1 Tax=Aphanomyces invadans TaxID=157072 RepID=A0A024U944_9STRA|nr:hypothetical protein H310_05721 [Aphanomyces invadans]ETW02148.1 hypothetical protein H310_05721 [Aphanomyces invadans]|eukprot:XP_008868753.1 hypothetical protein H310_05721 [Aphanomyces invadans]
MVLVTAAEFIPKFKALFAQEIHGANPSVTVNTKSIPSEKVGKLLRAHAVEAGPNVWLIRAVKNGNNKHKIKISTAVTSFEHTEFEAKLAAVMKAKMQGLAPTKKSMRHAKATTTQS